MTKNLNQVLKKLNICNTILIVNFKKEICAWKLRIKNFIL